MNTIIAAMNATVHSALYRYHTSVQCWFQLWCNVHKLAGTKSSECVWV